MQRFHFDLHALGRYRPEIFFEQPADLAVVLVRHQRIEILAEAFDGITVLVPSSV